MRGPIGGILVKRSVLPTREVDMSAKRGFVVGLVTGCLVGCLIGSYLEYTCVTAKNYRRLLKEYQEVRDNFHMTDAEMAEAGKELPQYFENEKRQDRMAAFIALVAYRILEEGDIEKAKSRLVDTVGLYYHLYQDEGGDVIDSIREAAQNYPDIAAEISKRD